MGVVISYIMNKHDIPEMTELSDEDISNIKRTWEIPRAIPLDAGEKILLKYFQTFPDYQNKFEHFKNTPLLILKGAPGFRSHAGKIMQMFDDTILILGEENYLGDMKTIWERAGRNHYRRSIPQKAFKDLKMIILEVLTEACSLTPNECKSWDNFFNNIYHILFETLDQMAARRR